MILKENRPSLAKEVACKYTGCWGDFTGYGEANRNAIAALHTAGVELTTEKVSYTRTQADYGETYELASKLEGRPIKYDIKILHVPSDGYLKFLEPAKYHIGHLFWETDKMSKTWVWNCNLMDEIWTGGNVHKENFKKAGVKVPIFVYPQAIDTNIRVEKPFRLPGHSGFLFYSIFQWIERKNPRKLLESYWKEFQGEENVSLLLKTYGLTLENHEVEKIRNDIRRWKTESELKSFPRVFLFFDLISKADMMRFHITGDCFVSAHRGEGWGIPQVEASLVGNPVISTNLGGVHEWFENGKTAYLLNWKPVKVFGMEFAPWYKTDQNWAEVDEGELRERMRYVFDNPDKARKVGLTARSMVMDRFSYLAVGQMMKDRLEDISRLIKK